MKIIEDCAIYFMPVVNDSGIELMLEAKVCMFVRNEDGIVSEGWASAEISTAADRMDCDDKAIRCFLDRLADFWRGRTLENEAVLKNFKETVVPSILTDVNQLCQARLGDVALKLGIQLFQDAVQDAVK